MSLERAIRELGPLEEFDPQLFIASDRDSQGVCDFVLALAVASNDLRDAWFARVALHEAAGQVPRGATAAWGLCGGLGVSSMKAVVGVLHELLSLLGDKRSIKAMKHELFRRVAGTLHVGERETLSQLTRIAAGQRSNLPLARTLEACRNKVAFHYDQKVIGRGYRSHFAREHKKAFISDGTAMNQIRFYFADAAVERFMHEAGLNLKDGSFLDLVQGVVRATVGVVRGFVRCRANETIG